MIGDPGGKDAERAFLDQETLSHNVAGITNDMMRFLANVSSLVNIDLDITVINNADFYRDVTYIDFLREV
jgi:tyrosyl-tRNA synthetase